MSDPIDVSVAQDGGIMKTIIEAAPEGALGPPPIGTEVTAHYTGESILAASSQALMASGIFALLHSILM